MELTIKEIIAVTGLLSGGAWFYWTQKFKPRVEFDIDCEFFFPREVVDDAIIEIRLVFNNMGHVQHTLRKLELSVHALGDIQELGVKPESNDVVFKERVLKRQSIVPDNWYYWVRPGVKQVFTKIIKLNRKHSVVRVTAGFAYGDFIKSRHTARRIFEVPDNPGNGD